MIPMSDRLRQMRPRAATLLAAYMLVLQGLALGFASGAGPGFGGVCLTGARAAERSAPATPARPSSHSDLCCVVHCSGLDGAALAAAFGGDSPRVASHCDAPALAAFEPLRAPRAMFPLGSRAPPQAVA
jgi:hypothetical protein